MKIHWKKLFDPIIICFRFSAKIFTIYVYFTNFVVSVTDDVADKVSHRILMPTYNILVPLLYSNPTKNLIIGSFNMTR